MSGGIRVVGCLAITKQVVGLLAMGFWLHEERCYAMENDKQFSLLRMRITSVLKTI